MIFLAAEDGEPNLKQLRAKILRQVRLFSGKLGRSAMGGWLRSKLSCGSGDLDACGLLLGVMCAKCALGCTHAHGAALH